MFVGHSGAEYWCVVVSLRSYEKERCYLLSFPSRGPGRCNCLDVECVGMCEKNKVKKKECEE